MSKICILTDSTAQFPALLFTGQELVNVIPLHVQIGDRVYTDGKDIRVGQLPASAKDSAGPVVLAPSVEEFELIFQALSRRYDEILTILISSHLCQAIANAQKAAENIRGPAAIHIVDSQTTAVGLGLLVQRAAETATRSQSSAAQISRLVRGILPHIYTVFCIQSLSYLYRSGHIDPAQAIVGEMLGVMPFYILENGRLVAVQKVRSSRHLVDLLHEFITEFTDLKHIALVQGAPPYEQEARNLRERLNGVFPMSGFSEHTLGAALATILGPRSLGLVAMEDRVDVEL